MRAMIITAAWLLTGILALASVTGYGAARAAGQMLEPVWPTPDRDPAAPAATLGGDARDSHGSRPRPAGEAVHLASYAHLVDHIRRHSPLDEHETRELAALLVHEGARYSVDPWLLAAVIEVESAYRSDAVGSAGEIGLMQILPGTGRRVAQSLDIPDFSQASLFDPETNVRLGAALLGQLLAEHRGDVVAALTAYNTGRSTSINGLHYAYRVLAVVDRIPSDVRLAWTPDPSR